MTDRKKGKKRKEDLNDPDEKKLDQPSKEEIAVAKWMRANIPIKKTKFLNHNVEYFTACKAIDGLLDSEWAKGSEPLFTTRDDVIDYLHVMLVHKFFHRARKVAVSEHELKSKKKDKKKDVESEDDRKKETDANAEKEQGTDGENVGGESGKKDGNKEKNTKKRKIRLDMHNDQRFVDGLDAYVWIYEPIPFYYWICGTLIVLGVIGVCLFPLWPPTVRLGVYYLSVAAAGFLVFIIILVILRLLIFCFVWVVTLGRHHIWILPNLTEDVGFFASFWPLYMYEYKGDKDESPKKRKKGSKDKKEKGSDGEEGNEEKNKVEDIATTETSQDSSLRQRKGKRRDGDEVAPSESESESSQRSSTGKDFEIVDQDDIET